MRLVSEVPSEPEESRQAQQYQGEGLITPPEPVVQVVLTKPKNLSEHPPVEERPVELSPGERPTLDQVTVTVHRRVEDPLGRAVLREQPLILDRATFEQALDHALEKAEVLVQGDELVPNLEKATLEAAQFGRPVTLHKSVNGIPATLAYASGRLVEGTLKLWGMSDTSARVAGGLVRGGLRFLFEPVVAPLKPCIVLIEVASLVLPAGDRGDPQIIENLIMDWVKEATGR